MFDLRDVREDVGWVIVRHAVLVGRLDRPTGGDQVAVPERHLADDSLYPSLVVGFAGVSDLRLHVRQKRKREVFLVTQLLSSSVNSASRSTGSGLTPITATSRSWNPVYISRNRRAYVSHPDVSFANRFTR